MPVHCPFDSSSRLLLRAISQLYHGAVPQTGPTIASSTSIRPTLSSIRDTSSLKNAGSFRQSINVRHLSSSSDSVVRRRNTATSSTRHEKTTRNLKQFTNTKEAARSLDSEAAAESIETDRRPTRKHEPWFLYKQALQRKFPEGWNPRKKISPDAQEGMRALHAQYPEQCTREVLASQFKISQEAVRRILKAKPRHPAMEARQRERWAKRHDQIWDNMSQIGLRPKRTSDRSPDDTAFTLPTIERSA